MNEIRSRMAALTALLLAVVSILLPAMTHTAPAAPLALHCSGTLIKDSNNTPIVLRGANIPGCEYNYLGDHIATSPDVLINTWKANIIRLPLNQDYWFGYDTTTQRADHGASYQAMIDGVVNFASAAEAYVLLDCHWGDAGQAWGTNMGQHPGPDDHTTTFWSSVAARYANNPAVLFDLWNEPWGNDWPTWQNGGTIPAYNGSPAYHCPGHQALVNAIRTAGANNIIMAEGMNGTNGAFELNGVPILTDATGNTMYEIHTYPDWGSTNAAWDGEIPAGFAHPVLLGEWGDDPNNCAGGVPIPDAPTWIQNFLAWLNLHSYNYTAWSFQTGTCPNMLVDWTYTPNTYFGQYVKADLIAHSVPPTPQAQIIAGTATIDGTVEAAWNGAPAYPMSKTVGTVSNSSDCSATWQGMWDSTNLYILVNVTDDVKKNDSTNAYDDDCVEVFLDADHNGGTVYDANDRQLLFRWNDATAHEGNSRVIAGVTFAQANPTGTTYRMEIKIPWAVEAYTAVANNIIGIDAHVDDDDDGAARDGEVCWNDGSDLAYQNPSLFGTGKLVTVTPPPAPTGLTATGGNTQVALAWSASSGATAYDVKRSTVSGSGYVTVSSPATTSYTNTGLTNGTTYYFVVDAKNAGGTSANSAQASAVPTGSLTLPFKINVGGPASSPFVADVDFSGGTTATNWTGTIDTSAVTSPAPQAVYQSERYGSPAMTYTIPGLTSGTPYTVRLHFCENYFTASAQRVFNVAINGTTVLTNFDIYAAAGAIHKANVQQFNTTGNGSGQIVITFTNVTNNALINGIEVLALSAPAAPTGLTATPGNTQAALSWTASSGATAYDVKRSTVSGSGYATVSSPTTTSYTNTGLANGTTYYFVVDAKNAGGTSANSAQVSATPSSGNTHGGTWSDRGVLPVTATFLNTYQSPTGTAPNQTYTASFWLKGTGSVLFQAWGGVWGTLIKAQTFTATSTWTQCSFTFSTGSNTQLSFVFKDPGGSGTIYIDDCFMGILNGTNMLTNPGFESGATGWTVDAGSPWTIVHNP